MRKREELRKILRFFIWIIGGIKLVFIEMEKLDKELVWGREVRIRR